MTTYSLPYIVVPPKAIEIIDDLISIALHSVSIDADKSTQARNDLKGRLNSFEAANIALLNSIYILIAQTSLIVERSNDPFLNKEYSRKLDEFYVGFWNEMQHKISIYNVKKGSANV